MIWQFLTTNWLRIALWTAVIGVAALGVQRINLSFTQAAAIAELHTINQTNLQSLEQLKHQYAKDTQAIVRQRDRAMKLRADAEKQLEAIRHASSEDNGVTRNIIRNALAGMREQSQGDTQ
jgi:hypothetical protein